MYKLSDDYYLRKHFLKTNEVPSQSLIKNKMSPPLAAIYFNSMSPKLKVLAGLEPPLKGGGGDWFVSPKDLVEGRAVLKPVKKECLSKLNYLGIDTIGMKMLELRLKHIKIERQKISLESDEKWKKTIEFECQQYFQEASLEAAHKNTERIQHAFKEFNTLYTSSISIIENMLIDAARNEIIKIRDEAFQKMKQKYETLVEKQATMLYDRYTNKIMVEKATLKAEFIQKLDEERSEMGEKIHDIKLEKHIAIEQVRKYMECQVLACQVYVALKEREECGKKIEQLKHQHKKKVEKLKDEILSKDFEIMIQVKKEKKQQEFDGIWRKKALHVVKKFQIFVSYCLSLLPDYAEFFINMEKLMLLQLNEALDDPSAESIFEVEEDLYEGPIPQPNPFYVFCDKVNKTTINQNLCPKHSSSIASQMPAIIINKQCMYAACDTFEQFVDKIKYYIHGKRGDDADFVDDLIYEHYVPVKYTASQQLLELKLESSLLQVLQQEIPNLREVPIECGVCEMPDCFCIPPQVPKASVSSYEKTIKQQSSFTPVENKVVTRGEELEHLRQPKWESYINNVKTKKCGCTKTCKKHLMEHLPVYMRNVSVFDTPELLNYETCSFSTLQNMVKWARGNSTPPPQLKTAPLFRDVATQYSDQEFEFLCQCFADDELEHLFKDQITGSKMFDSLIALNQFRIMDDSVSTSYLTRRPVSFARGRAHSLRYLIDDSPELKDIFKISGRAFD